MNAEILEFLSFYFEQMIYASLYMTNSNVFKHMTIRAITHQINYLLLIKYIKKTKL
jgi:hypothetical protein